MSFFAQLLAGAATGIGKGMIDQADYNDKLAAQQELLKEKHANAMQLQEQKANERLFQAQTIAALKGSGGGGSVDVFSRLRSANPEDQRMALGEIRALGGDDAANLAEESILGRAPMRQRPADFVGLPGQSDMGPDAKITERVEYDKIKGQQALNRVYALIANKGQTKNNAEGEALYFGNDARTAAVTQELKRGKSLVEATDVGARVADPAEYDRNQANRERIDASIKNANTRATTTSDTTDLKGRASLIKYIEGQIVDLLKITGDEMRYNDEARKQAAEMLPLKRAELAELKRNGAATATVSKPTANWTATGGAPRPAGKVPTLDELRAKYSR